MNLAISTLVVFLIVSPAIIARRIYFIKELSRNFVSQNTLQEILSAIFLSFPLHFIWIAVAEGIGHSIDFNIFFKLLFNPRSISDYSNITNNVANICFYFTSLCAVSALFGFLIRNTIRTSGMDRKFGILRFDNKWSYLLTGEVLDIRKYNSVDVKSKDITSIQVEVFVKSDESQVFTGRLADWQLNDSNSVDFIVLAGAKKTGYVEETIKNGDVETVKISKTDVVMSGYVVIPYSDVLHIHILFTF